MEGRGYEAMALAVISAVILFALLRQCWSQSDEAIRRSAVSSRNDPARGEKVEGSDPEDPQVVYRYILDVIRHGSARLDFPGGVMEGGYLPEEEAPKVACYVMELGGHRCPRPYPKDAAMFYTSVCGGCHGNDGKGLHGAYPDLTRHRLLGLEQLVKKNSPR